MAKKPRFQDIEKVMRDLVLPFYATERTIPLPLPNQPSHNENDAEHSWSLALIACMLAPHIDTSLDTGKICQFAVIHDLTEIHAGDTSAFAADADHETKEEREHQALLRIKKDFGHLPWIVDTLEAYERQDTDEARYVRSIDKMIPLFEDYITGGLYYHAHKHTKEDFLRLVERPRQKAKIHPGAFVYHEEALAALLSHPEFFHPGKKRSLD